MMNKKLCLLAAALFACAGSVSAADAPEKHPVYQSYSDFQWVGVMKQADNGSKECRIQFDFTKPVHGPWLTNPEYGSMTVSWITRIPCGAGIEYREKGTADFTRVWHTYYGQIHANTDLHHIFLENLKPGTEYEYRLISMIDKFTGYGSDSVYTGQEIYSFRTLDPKRSEYKVFVSSDIHGSLRLLLDPMLDRTKSADADFFIYLGDNVEDTLSRIPRYHITFGFLDDIVRRYGSFKPSVFIRGNHDTNGECSYDFMSYFPHKNEKGYYTVRQGNVLFIALDDGRWHGPCKPMAAQALAYRQEQAEWIKRLKKTDEWKSAEFRIVMSHVPPYNGQSFGDADELTTVFDDDSKDGRIHLFLSGHEHVYRRNDKNTVTSKVFPHSKSYTSDVAAPHPYTHVTCDSGEAMNLNIQPGKLNVVSYKWRKEPMEKGDDFTILPDGSVKDNIKVEVFQPKEPAPKKGKK